MRLEGISTTFLAIGWSGATISLAVIEISVHGGPFAGENRENFEVTGNFENSTKRGWYRCVRTVSKRETICSELISSERWKIESVSDHRNPYYIPKFVNRESFCQIAKQRS